MTDNIDEIRDRIHDARKEGYTKEQMVIVAGHEFVRNLSTDPLGLTAYESEKGLSVDGVPVVETENIEKDSMVVIAGSNYELDRATAVLEQTQSVSHTFEGSMW